MIKFTQGTIKNVKGEVKDIVVKAVCPNSLKDALIGGGIMLLGVTYLTYTAFRNGSKAFETAEFQTLMDLDLIKK